MAPLTGGRFSDRSWLLLIGQFTSWHRYIHWHTYISLTMIIIIIFTHRVHHLHARRSNRWQTNVKIESSRSCVSVARQTDTHSLQSLAV